MLIRSSARQRTRAVLGSFVAIVLAMAAVLVACDQEGPTGPMFVSGVSASTTLIDTETPEWVGNLLNGATHLVADGASTQEELPGMGHKFELFFAMMDDQDPQNLTNDVVSVLTTPADIGVAVRNLPPGIRIEALDHQLNLQYYFPSRSCAGGSPRIQLAIDRDGDGTADGNAFGYVGHAPFGAGCLTAEWDIMDMTDNVARWDLTQFGGTPNMTWDMAEEFVATTYPNHRVETGSIVDDSCGFAPTSCGQAYYDLLTVENRTLENDQDTVH